MVARDNWYGRSDQSRGARRQTQAVDSCCHSVVHVLQKSKKAGEVATAEFCDNANFSKLMTWNYSPPLALATIVAGRGLG
jgi:hypothetical protein